MRTVRVNTNLVKGMILLLIFISLTLYSAIVRAQSSLSPEKNEKHTLTKGSDYDTKYKGFGVSFGVRMFTLSSNIPSLNGLSVLQEGGQGGFFFGNRVLRMKVGVLGFFYSAANVPQTINVFEGEGALNYYLLNFAKGHRTVEPYLTTGLIYNNIRFSGFYLTDREVLKNTSQPEPYLGAIHKVDASVGAGVEVGLLNFRQFVNLFTEIKYGINLYQAASKQAFNETSVGNQVLVSLGLRFGSFR